MIVHTTPYNTLGLCCKGTFLSSKYSHCVHSASLSYACCLIREINIWRKSASLERPSSLLTANSFLLYLYVVSSACNSCTLHAYSCKIVLAELYVATVECDRCLHQMCMVEQVFSLTILKITGSTYNYL